MFYYSSSSFPRPSPLSSTSFTLHFDVVRCSLSDEVVDSRDLHLRSHPLSSVDNEPSRKGTSPLLHVDLLLRFITVHRIIAPSPYPIVQRASTMKLKPITKFPCWSKQNFHVSESSKPRSHICNCLSRPSLFLSRASRLPLQAKPSIFILFLANHLSLG